MSPINSRQPTYRNTPESREGKVMFTGLVGYTANSVPRSDVRIGRIFLRSVIQSVVLLVESEFIAVYNSCLSQRCVDFLNALCGKLDFFCLLSDKVFELFKFHCRYRGIPGIDLYIVAGEYH